MDRGLLSKPCGLLEATAAAALGRCGLFYSWMGDPEPVPITQLRRWLLEQVAKDARLGSAHSREVNRDAIESAEAALRSISTSI